jgi:hypothetical protein
MARSGATTPAGCKRLASEILRSQIGIPLTDREQRKARAKIREGQPKLKPKQVDKNSYRHPDPTARQRCPRDMPKRRAPGWVAINFVLPRMTLKGLTLLTKFVVGRERAERSNEPYGFRRRYPKTKNYFVVMALNHLLEEHGLSEFCVEETEPMPGRVRRFVTLT